MPSDYHDLRVWREGHEVAQVVWHATASFPRTERFGLIPQLRRSALSVPCNLAEGCGRRTTRELRQFGNIASGSASELAYQLEFSHAMRFLDDEAFATLAIRVANMRRGLAGLDHSLARKIDREGRSQKMGRRTPTKPTTRRDPSPAGSRTTNHEPRARPGRENTRPSTT